MQRQRRRDPYPWTWEPPVLTTVAVLMTLIVGIQLSRALGNLLAGGGWTWPDTHTSFGFSSPLASSFWTSLPDVLAGHADAGLASPTPDNVAGPALVWICLVVVEAALITVLAWAIVAVVKRWGPGRMRGMATTSEAESLLGVSRLRKVAHVVRPDIYGDHAAEAQLVHHDAGDPPRAPVTPHEEASPWLLSRITRKNR